MNKLFIAVCFVTFTASVNAHPGRTNSEGCHNNRKTGDYHCHGGGGSARSSHQSSNRTTKMLCTDFDNQDEAQEYFERTRDRRLDRDGDGVACETQFGGGSSSSASAAATAAMVYSVASLPPANDTQDIFGRVVGISDGDTLTVLDSNNTQHKIRLNAIDAPEIGQPFGQNSKQALSEICFNRQTFVRYVDTDRYGRIVGDVQCDGEDASTYLVTKGLAWVYDKYVGNYQHLYTYQKSAKNNELGLWSDRRPVPPWDWRDGVRTSTNQQSEDVGDRIEKALGQIFRGLF